MEKIKGNLGNLITIVIFAIGLVGSYIDGKVHEAELQKDVESIKIVAEANRKELKDNNLQLINYKLDEIMKLLQER